MEAGGGVFVGVLVAAAGAGVLVGVAVAPGPCGVFVGFCVAAGWVGVGVGVGASIVIVALRVLQAEPSQPVTLTLFVPGLL